MMVAAVDDLAPLLMPCLHEAQAIPGSDFGTRAALLVGSFARGWANATSDFDVCVVSERPFEREGLRASGVPLELPVISTWDAVVDGRRAEVAYWTTGQVDQILDKVSWERFESGRASLVPLVDVEETLVERFSTAIVLEDDGWLAQARARVDASAFRAFITASSISSADGKIEDIEGMLEADDLESAVLAARLALDHMVDAMLDGSGVFGSRIPKWRMRRLRDLVAGGGIAPLTPDRYWSLTTMVDADLADLRPWIDDVVSECQSLSLKIDI